MIFLFSNYCRMQCILGFEGGKVTLVIFDHSSNDHGFAGDQNHSSFSFDFWIFLFNDHKESNFVVAFKNKTV